MIKRGLVQWTLLLALVFGGHTVAAEYEEGKQYVRLASPLPTLHKDKIEVVEFFWYGCVHCYHLSQYCKPGRQHRVRMFTWSARPPCGMTA